MTCFSSNLSNAFALVAKITYDIMSNSDEYLFCFLLVKISWNCSITKWMKDLIWSFLVKRKNLFSNLFIFHRNFSVFFVSLSFSFFASAIKFLTCEIRVISSSSSFEGHPLQARHKQNWGRGFILLLPQTAALPGSDAGSDVVKPASSFVIPNPLTSCSMWCPMYRARC